MAGRAISPKIDDRSNVGGEAAARAESVVREDVSIAAAPTVHWREGLRLKQAEMPGKGVPLDVLPLDLRTGLGDAIEKIRIADDAHMCRSFDIRVGRDSLPDSDEGVDVTASSSGVRVQTS